MKILDTHIAVMAIEKDGRIITDMFEAWPHIKSGKFIPLTWSGKDPLFYYNVGTGQVVLPNDIMCTYLLDGQPATAVDLLRASRPYGFVGIDTQGAAVSLTDNGHVVSVNPQPSEKAH